MYSKKTFHRGLAYNFLSCLFKSNFALKQEIEFENFTTWTIQCFPHMSTPAEKGNWRIVEDGAMSTWKDRNNKSSRSVIKNESALDINLTVLPRIRSGAVLLLLSVSLTLVSFSWSITRNSNLCVPLLHRTEVLTDMALSTSLLNKCQWSHSSPCSNWTHFLT